MRTPICSVIGTTILLVTLQSAAAAPKLTAAEQKALTPVFTAAEKGIRDLDEPRFKAQFHPEGYANNLVGGSGLSGAKTFRQGTRKSWYLRPRWAEGRSTGGDTALVPCEVFRWTDGKVVDRVDAALVKHQGRWLVLGGGEKRAEVEALLERWKNKQPLSPPARP
jgi:hypothetical protein